MNHRRPIKRHCGPEPTERDLVRWLHADARYIVAEHWDLLGLDDPWPHVGCPAERMEIRPYPHIQLGSHCHAADCTTTEGGLS